MIEVWKPMKKPFDATHQISNHGNVKNSDGNILTPRKRKSYKHATISVFANGNRMEKSIYKLVAEHFVPRRSDNIVRKTKYKRSLTALRDKTEIKEVIKHKDGDTTNNRADNLYYELTEIITRKISQNKRPKKGYQTNNVLKDLVNESGLSIRQYAKKYNLNLDNFQKLTNGGYSEAKFSMLKFIANKQGYDVKISLVKKQD